MQRKTQLNPSETTLSLSKLLQTRNRAKIALNPTNQTNKSSLSSNPSNSRHISSQNLSKTLHHKPTGANHFQSAKAFNTKENRSQILNRSRAITTPKQTGRWSYPLQKGHRAVTWGKRISDMPMTKITIEQVMSLRHTHPPNPTATPSPRTSTITPTRLTSTPWLHQPTVTINILRNPSKTTVRWCRLHLHPVLKPLTRQCYCSTRKRLWSCMRNMKGW